MKVGCFNSLLERRQRPGPTQKCSQIYVAMNFLEYQGIIYILHFERWQWMLEVQTNSWNDLLYISKERLKENCQNIPFINTFVRNGLVIFAKLKWQINLFWSIVCTVEMLLFNHLILILVFKFYGFQRVYWATRRFLT